MSLTTAGHAEDIRAFKSLLCKYFFSLTGNNLGCLATSKHRQIRTF